MHKKEIAKVKSVGSPGDCVSLLSNMVTDLVHPILSFALLVCCLPLLLIISLIHCLLSNAVSSAILKKHSDVMMVRHQDALYLQKSDNNMLNSLLTLKGKTDLAKLRKLIQERLVDARGESGHLNLPKLTRFCKGIAQCSVWVKDKTFDLREHVFKWNCQPPKTREELETLLGYLSSQTLPKNKSPWQVVMIPSSSLLDRQCFVLIRLHHSIADSANFNEIILRQLADVKSQHHQIPPSSGVRKKYMQALKVVSSGPSLLLHKLSLSVEDHKLYGQPLSRDKLTSWSEQLDCALIKEMAKSAKSSANAVLISCLTGALRDYLKYHSHKVPEDILACVSIPSEISEISLSENNSSAFVVLSLPLSLGDPIRQLEAIKSRLENSFSSVEPTLNTLINSQFMGKMPLWITSTLNRVISDKCTLVLNEVSCPESKLFIGGNAVEDIIVWSGQPPNVGISVSIVSYNGQVKVSLMVDRATMNDPSLLLNSFEAQLEHLARILNVL